MDRETAVTRRVDGRTVWFCSEGCADTLEAGQAGHSVRVMVDSAGPGELPSDEPLASGASGRGGGGSA